MGDVRNRDGILEHNYADRGEPADWRRIAYTDTGKPLPDILVLDDVATALDSESGHIVWTAGAYVWTMPPERAATVNDALAQHVVDGKAIVVAAAVAQIQERIDDARTQHAELLVSFDEEIQAKQELLDAAAAAVDALPAQDAKAGP